jgi:hypothetical protein
MAILKCLLQDAERAVGIRESLYGRNFPPVDLTAKLKAGAHGTSVHQYRARSANAMLTAVVRTCLAKLVTKKIA